MSVTFPYSFGIHHAEVRIEEAGTGKYAFQLTFTDGHTDTFTYSTEDASANAALDIEGNEARKEAVESFHILLQKKGG
ncbi:hypothetical protein [Foetidibacter luteolus]|uniref:hypothetical protein n=1 Tax=Foetidibacter luteolus TaxID=2608880 RepID=UPI00129AB842|nr:hypothetical protein [Foetidibacter luteolus]